MTQGLEKALNIPSLEEVLAEQPDNDEIANAGLSDLLDMAGKKIELATGTDHSRDTDDIYEKALKHAQDIMDYGFNIDHARAAALFEQGNALFKTALDAKNSKRDAELKAMKLQLEREKLEFMKNKTAPANQTIIEAEGVTIIDRNELLRQLKNGS